ncbi:MAG: hypothetical protein CL927_12970 [Deltaproteobacteria bacterium]|nr:hypothetical protein [Deltaproteobacteria bacterium]
MSRWSFLPLVFSIACVDTDPLVVADGSERAHGEDQAEDIGPESVELVGRGYDLESGAGDAGSAAPVTGAALCDGELLSAEGARQVLYFTERTDHETIYTTYDRVDAIAEVFETCGDPWGMFPTTYRRITARGLQAIADDDFDDHEWARRIIVDFAGRYMDNLGEALRGGEPSWAWAHYYNLADRSDVSRTRAVLVAMVAHLTLDLPHSLLAIGTYEENKDDFFVFGEMMIEVSDLLIGDLQYYYGADAEDILNGFFFGDWVDGAFGDQATITLSYQTIRTKAWNGRWMLDNPVTAWIADSEIWAAFWTIDGVLATLDAADII